MVKPVLIAITGTQQLAGEKPESIQLVTEGSYCCEPGFIRFSYVESEMTGMEGVVTSFTVEDEQKLTLRRVGKVNSEMVFVQGQRHESLYDAGMAAGRRGASGADRPAQRARRHSRFQLRNRRGAQCLRHEPLSHRDPRGVKCARLTERK